MIESFTLIEERYSDSYPFIFEVRVKLVKNENSLHDLDFWVSKLLLLMRSQMLKSPTMKRLEAKSFLSDKDWSTMMRNAEIVAYKKGDCIIKQGEDFEYFYKVNIFLNRNTSS